MITTISVRETKNKKEITKEHNTMVDVHNYIKKQFENPKTKYVKIVNHCVIGRNDI